MRHLITRGRIWILTTVSGGGLLVLEGCDPTVRETVLGGVGSAATSLAGTFINAFIQSLQGSEDDTVSTVKAIVEMAPQYFA